MTHSIVLPQRSEFSMTRDLNYSKLTLYHLQTVATACSKVYQVKILVSVHPARRMRTHSIPVTVRSAHSMASSSTYQSDSLPVSSACIAQRCYKSQSRRLKNEGEKFSWHYTPLCTAIGTASATTKLLPTALHTMSTPPSTFLDPPLST